MSEQNEKPHAFEFDVFARIKRGDDLIHIGTVKAETEELAKVYATFTYDEEDWVEMCVIRRDQLNWVRRPKGLFAKEGV
jgi:1,2-phenylacetyl-CoA epoxidase PaaB subunit